MNACCPICGRRFAVSESHRFTCSTTCRDERLRRFRTHTPIVAHVAAAERAPNRARAALRETRATVEQLLAEGRRAARLTSDLGDRS